MLMIVFAGCDKVGKTTLIKALHKETNFKYPILDRFTDSAICYGRYRNRELDYSQYYELEKGLMNKVLLVYCTARNEDIEKRMIKHDEKDIVASEIDSLKEQYAKYLSETMFENIIIDTSNLSISKAIYEITKKINRMENDNAIEITNRLKDNIIRNGHDVNGTYELLGVDFTITQKPDMSHIKKYYEVNDFDFDLIDEEELYFYDRIEKTIRHLIKAQIKEYGQNAYSRKFQFSSTECINSYHLIYRGETLYCYVTIRSSNVPKILPLDIYYCYDIAEKMNKEFFKASDIKCEFRIVSAHVYHDGKTKK
jgi:thymidylate kinase